MTGVSVRRCCPRSARSMCSACIDKLPDTLRSNLARTYDDADLIAHAYATDAALLYLESLQPNKPVEVPS